MVEYAPSNEPEASKRRSTRVVQAIPLTVTGVDALGQTFRERTSTLIINCHGFKFQSKHYVLKGSWLDYEVPHSEAGKPPRKGRGQVTFVQRPRTAKELFQVGVEMEIAGNVWGIAFPPDDWIAFSEAAEDDILRPAPPAKPAAEVHPPQPAGPISMPLHAVPPTPLAPPADLPANLKQQVTRMLAEAQEQIQQMAREAGAAAVAREANTLLRDLNIQLKVAAEKTVEQTSAGYADELVRKALKKFQEAQESSAQELRTSSTRQFEKDLHDSSQRTLAKLAEAGETLRADFSQRLSADAAAAQGRAGEIENKLKEKLAEFAAHAETTPSLVANMRKEIDAIAEDAKKQWGKRLASYAESGLSRLSELDEAARKLQEKIQATADAAQTGWRQKLEHDLTEAGARLENTRATALKTAEQQLAEQLEKTTAGAVSKAAVEMDQRAEEIRAQVKSAAEETARRMAAGQASLDETLHKSKVGAAEIDAAASRVREESRQLEAQARNASAEMVRQFEAMLADNRLQLNRQTESVQASLTQRLEQSRQASAEMVSQFEALLADNRAQLHQQTESVLAGLSQRLEKELAEHGTGMVTRVAADVEKQVAPRLHRAEETMQKLKELEATATQTLRQEQARLQSEFAQASRTVLERCLEELETKSTDTTHETFEQLYKSAEWYQRKAQASMQTAFDKGINQASVSLREKAGEISTMFASELDHYSRSYSEHTQGLLEEAANEMAVRMRAQFVETTDAGVAQFSDEIHRLAENKVQGLQATSDSTVEAARDRMASQAEIVCRQLDAQAAQSASEFQKQIAERLRQGVNETMQDFQKQLVPVLDKWRAEAQAHQAQWLQSLDRQGTESVEQYKQRLENVSNSWMVATVTTLSQRSQGVLDAMAKAVEQRLRDTCAEMFAGMGESMQQRLLAISTELKKGSGE